jgi:hypothetical protein
MPDRRTIKKGSFGGNIDELLKHLDEKQGRQPQGQPDKSDGQDADKQSIHDKLFEKSWHATRKRGQPSRFSNQ